MSLGGSLPLSTRVLVQLHQVAVGIFEQGLLAARALFDRTLETNAGSFQGAICEARSSTAMTIRFKPPRSCRRPSGIARDPELPGPLSTSRRLSRSTSGKTREPRGRPRRRRTNVTLSNDRQARGYSGFTGMAVMTAEFHKFGTAFASGSGPLKTSAYPSPSFSSERPPIASTLVQLSLKTTSPCCASDT